VLEYRWAEGHYDRLPVLAADLVGRKVDVIAAFSTPSALAAKGATSTIPIVFATGDPVERGLVASLARPGGNLTGVSILTVELMAKRLELLSELVPQATDLVGRKVDVIAAFSTPSALAAKGATSTIPIVFATGDPVERGLVASLARPGGNLTVLTVELMAKRLELLSELVPQARVIALLVNPNSPIAEPIMRDVQEAARAKWLQLHILKAGTESEIDAAFASLVQLHEPHAARGGALAGAQGKAQATGSKTPHSARSHSTS
jgi:ABC-type uncharacterized transport system substrate-binding protein